MGAQIEQRPPAAAGEPRRRASQLPLALVTALLGFVLATQLHAREGLKVRLASERETDLARILADVSVARDAVQEEIVNLRVRLASTRGSAEQERALVDNAKGQLDALRILLGLTAVRGPGIALTVADPEAAIGPEVLLDVIQELRDAGAEAIEVNGVRIVASTSFAGSSGGVTISGAQVTAPYRISAIGNADTMAEALKIPGGVVDSVSSHSGAAIVIEKRREVTIRSLRPPPRFTYATPS